MQNTIAAPHVSVSNAPRVAGKIARIALGTAVLAASSWISIPLAPIPITMQTYAVIVIGALFGARLGSLTVLAWLAEAAVGLPVLAQGAAGIAVFAGPSAGYLFSFPVIAAFVGWLSDRRFDRGLVRTFGSMLVANAVNLGLGVLWLASFLGWRRAVIAGFLPFWIGGVAKTVLATITITMYRSRSAKGAANLR